MSAKKPVEWAYQNENEEWTLADKAVLSETVMESLEKSIGFEGTPDPATGYYCLYDGGKILNL